MRRGTTDSSRKRYWMLCPIWWGTHCNGGRKIEVWGWNTSHHHGLLPTKTWMLRNGPFDNSCIIHSSARTISPKNSSRNPNMCTCCTVWPPKQYFSRPSNCRVPSNRQMLTLTPLGLRTSPWRMKGWREWAVPIKAKKLTLSEAVRCYRKLCGL